MKALLLRFIPTLLCVFFLHTGFAQQIDSMMSIYEAQTPREKVHIHFDRTVYNKDETIWYKVYVLTSTNELTRLSTNVYVEWYDTTGRMIRQTVAPLFQSTAKGSFDLPADYKGNTVHVRAYTRWMLNEDSVFMFQKDIALNSVSAPVSRPVIPKTRVDAFPEGGVLVQGLASRVAFKATTQFGVPVFIKGAVYAGKKFIDTLIVKHDGMGSFFITPQPGVTYQLNWADENGKRGSTVLEAAKPEGVNITVTATNDKAIVTLQRTNGAPDNYKKLSLRVHMNQLLLYKVSLNATEKTSLRAELPIDELPTGILQFTLFSADEMPLVERILFVNNRQHEFNARVTAPLVSVDKRGKNVVEVYVADTAFTNMSMSITDAAASVPETNSIFSDILLSSEIRGRVYNPAYYLMSDADSVTANLDLVMLTNGWRRFNWDKLKAGVMPQQKYPVETDYLKITGKVYGVKTGLTATPLQLNFILRSKDSSTRFVIAPVAKDGVFEVPNQFFYDTVKAYYSFNGNSRLTDVTQVQVDNGLLRFAPKKSILSPVLPGPWNDSLARIKMNYIFNEQEKLRKSMASTTLAEVTVKAKVKPPLQILEEKYTSGLFSGGDGMSFDPNERGSAGAMDIFAYLQGRVAGLMISGSGPQTSLSWRGATPTLYLNEMESQIDVIQTISIADIAYVKVIRPPFFGAAGGGAGGAIAIYLKKGADGRKSDNNSKSLESTIIGGYSKFKEFFNPTYEKESNPDPDLRTTLYWNPYVLTNKKSPRLRVQFYNNDITKQFLLVLEGVNGSGKMTRVVKMIDAKTDD